MTEDMFRFKPKTFRLLNLRIYKQFVQLFCEIFEYVNSGDEFESQLFFHV